MGGNWEWRNERKYEKEKAEYETGDEVECDFGLGSVVGSRDRFLLCWGSFDWDWDVTRDKLVLFFLSYFPSPLSSNRTLGSLCADNYPLRANTTLEYLYSCQIIFSEGKHTAWFVVLISNDNSINILVWIKLSKFQFQQYRVHIKLVMRNNQLYFDWKDKIIISCLYFFMVSLWFYQVKLVFCVI